VDGIAQIENNEVDQSDFDWVTRLNIGWSADLSDKCFEGKIKNLSYKGLSENRFEIVDLLFEMMETI
jgi:hypothetical protein